MREEKSIVRMEPRESQACAICSARNIDTRKIRIDARDGSIAVFCICRPCMRKMAIDMCTAYFEFADTEPARTPGREVSEGADEQAAGQA